MSVRLPTARPSRDESLVEARWRAYQLASAKRYRARERARMIQRVDNLLGKGAWPSRALLVRRSGLWLPGLKFGLGAEPMRAVGLLAYVRSGPDPQAAPKALFDQAW